MAKFRTFNKIAIMLLVLAMSAFLIMGCQSKNSGSSQNSSGSNGRRTFNADAVKQRYEQDLQALVKAGTITQDQSTKILDSLTANMNNMGQGRRRTNSQGNSQNNTAQGNGKNNQTGTPRNNPLSKLVSDGVITQEQADKVMQGLRGNRQNSNNQSNQSNQ
ncbi:MAG: hypothetical protein ABF633_11875 [Clostridium sp.]|uniref:hypothetical protein n=1 Tax=Clostridium sp. TaxID=1506 RepID=UPI0039E9261E